MNVKIEKIDGNIVAILEGNLDTAAAAETEKAMSPLNDVEGKDIIIDCTDLTYISSGGLRVLLEIEQVMEDRDGEMRLIHVNEHIIGVFDLVGFMDIVKVEND